MHRILALFLSISCLANGLTVQPFMKASLVRGVGPVQSQRTLRDAFVLHAATDENSGNVEVSPSDGPVLKPRNDSPVEMSVTRIMQQKPEKPAPQQDNLSDEMKKQIALGSNSGDSMEMLLQDAKLMQEQQGGVDTSEEKDSIKSKIRNVLSTIVTVDFFIVCGFLLWFLLGIFCSSILKDDTVQIAFNMSFQAFVQPALGLLMIAAVAGNFFEEEEEPEYY